MDEIMSRVATALMPGYVSMYYVNISTGEYQCYSLNQGCQTMELITSGEDFFSDLRRDVKTVVWEEDQDLLTRSLTRESLRESLKTENETSLVYRVNIDGAPVYHSMRILKDLSGQEDTLILGVLNVDSQMRMEQATQTFNDIANSLAERYVTIFYVDIETDHFVEYSSNKDYKDLAISEVKNDFFTESRQNILLMIHPDDQEKMFAALDKETMLENTEQQKRFILEYRLLIDDTPHYMRLTAVRSRNDDHLIIALDAIDNEIRQQEALKEISERNVIFSQIAESLASQYGMICYINAETDEYIEFSASELYKGLNISPSGNDFFGTSQRNVSMIVHPNDRERVFQALDKKTMLAALQEKGIFSISYQLQLNHDFNYTRMTVFWANDKKHLVMAIMDINNEIERENEYKRMLEENEVFFQIAESLAKQYDTIYYVDMLTDHYVEFSSTDVYKSLNVPTSGVDFFTESANDLHRVIYADDQEGLLRFLDKQSLVRALQKQHMLTHDYRIVTGNGVMYARMSIIWATDNKHLIMGVMNIDQEVRHENEVQAKLVAANEKAYRDDLTGVKNKSAYTDYVRNLQKSIDQQSAPDFAVLVCDVNGLKEVNDSRGHIEGDSYIQAACRLICRVWDHSPVFRIGGDEFVVMILGEDYQNRDRLLKAMRDQVLQNKQRGEITIATGMSVYDPSSDNAVSQVFDRADTLMYENKSGFKQK